MAIKFWDHQAIIEYILDLHAGRTPLYSSYVQRNYPALHRAAFRYFGNWETAIVQAGLNYRKICRYHRWNRRQIIAGIREAHRAGEDLSWRQFSLGEHSALAYAAINKRYFGSWDAALEAAGMRAEQVRRYRHWTPDRLRRKLRQLAADGADLSAGNMQGMDPGLYHAACRQFGSWRQALDESGIDYTRIFQRIHRSREDLLNELVGLGRLGMSLTASQVRRYYPALYASAVRHFGSWRTACREAAALNRPSEESTVETETVHA